MIANFTSESVMFHLCPRLRLAATFRFSLWYSLHSLLYKTGRDWNTFMKYLIKLMAARLGSIWAKEHPFHTFFLGGLGTGRAAAPWT